MTSEMYRHDLKNAQGMFAADRIEFLELTPELLSFLRETIRPPFADWDETDPANGYLETLALICLTFSPSEEALEDVLNALEVAAAEDHEWVTEIAPYTLAAFGNAGFDAVLARIQTLESEQLANLEAETEDTFWHYTYLLSALVQATLTTGRREEYASLARERLQNPKFPINLKENWVGDFLEVRDEELLRLAEGFFAEMGTNFHSMMVGDLESYRSIWLEGRPRRTPRVVALENFRYARQRIDDDRNAALNPGIKNAFGIPLPPTEAPRTTFFKPAGVKVGRNDPCPCGSGKKFKHCHGKNGVTHYVP
jgi:SEC-C motif